MSNTLQNLMIAEGQSKRRSLELEERHNYQTKMISNKNAELTDLSQNVARLEKEMRVQQEGWRKTDNERQIRYVQSKLGDKHEDDRSGLQRPSTAGPMASTMATNLNVQDNKAAKELERKNYELSSQIAKLQLDIKQLNQWQECCTCGATQGGNAKQIIE